jgi:hypothetical protein
MIPKPFDIVGKADIDNLVSEGRPERRAMEYKQTLPNLALEQDYIEFLADVCSFANASGGDILYGVVDQRDATNKPTGIPDSSPGVNVANPDCVILQLEQTARSKIDPKMPGLQMKAIGGFPLGPVVLARVPKSYIGPHMVRNKKDWGRFYSRGSNGKHILDIGEIRDAFGLAGELSERIRGIPSRSLNQIKLLGIPMRFPNNDIKMILHLIPLSALAQRSVIDLAPVTQAPQIMQPLGPRGGNDRPNFDGFLVFNYSAYVQLFRSGAMEAVHSTSYEEQTQPLYFADYEDVLISGLNRFLHVQQKLQLVPPIFIMLTLDGVQGKALGHRKVVSGNRHTIDRDTLFLPDVVVEDFSAQAETVLRPIFDAVWQSSGWYGSPRYKP